MLALLSGIGPADLLASPPGVIAAMWQILEERAAQADEQQLIDESKQYAAEVASRIRR